MSRVPKTILLLLIAGSLSGCGVFSSSREGIPPEERLKLGKKHLEEGKYDEAIEELEAASEGAGEEFKEEARFLLAEAYFKDRWFYPAFRQYKKHLEDFPITPLLETIEEREFSMAVDLLQGRGRTFLGFHFREGESLGLEILNHIIASFPTGKYLSDSRRLLAAYYFDRREYEDALLEYEELRKKCPESIWKALADFRVGLCNLLQSRGYQYDRNILLNAKEEMLNYLFSHPEGSQREEAMKNLRFIDNLLAQKDLAIAEYYLSRGETLSARAFLSSLVEEYPESIWAEKGKHLLKQEEEALLERNQGFSREEKKE